MLRLVSSRRGPKKIIFNENRYLRLQVTWSVVLHAREHAYTEMSHGVKLAELQVDLDTDGQCQHRSDPRGSRCPCLLTSNLSRLIRYAVNERGSLMPIGRSGVTRCIAGCLVRHC